ncbi:hypothetical protein CQW23_13505 [Capsicum baccatum]|uniref:Uncharacterized protein n=1 Tax=Capsicum baccatum TaxID=33114 RepID=A0A2G2WGG3_CAPBA|nr:hypothetical protein CQW23_13505 [Capsicum baccatum]
MMESIFPFGDIGALAGVLTRQWLHFGKCFYLLRLVAFCASAMAETGYFLMVPKIIMAFHPSVFLYSARLLRVISQNHLTELNTKGHLLYEDAPRDKRQVKGTSGLAGDGDGEGEEMNNSIPSRDTVGRQTVINLLQQQHPLIVRVTEHGINGSLGSDSVKVFKDNANVEIHRRPNQETHSFVGGSICKYGY